MGRASTEAFVTSFIVILVLDFFLTMLLLKANELLIGGRRQESAVKQSEPGA